MEHKFPLGSLHRENGTNFSGIPFIPDHFQWNEPKRRVPFTSQPEFPELFGKWKRLKVNCSLAAIQGQVTEQRTVKWSIQQFNNFVVECKCR